MKLISEAIQKIWSCSGGSSEKVRVISEEKPVTVNSLLEQLKWEAIEVRDTERGKLNDSFASIRVYTVYEEEKVVKDIAEEVLFLR